MKGFHLIEFAITLAITSILFGISAPFIKEVTQLQSLKVETNKIKNVLSTAHRKANRENIKIVITLLKIQKITPKITVQSKVKKLVFYKSGAMTPATLEISNHKTSCKLTASLRGRIRTTCK